MYVKWPGEGLRYWGTLLSSSKRYPSRCYRAFQLYLPGDTEAPCWENGFFLNTLQTSDSFVKTLPSIWEKCSTWPWKKCIPRHTARKHISFLPSALLSWLAALTRGCPEHKILTGIWCSPGAGLNSSGTPGHQGHVQFDDGMWFPYNSRLTLTFILLEMEMMDGGQFLLSREGTEGDWRFPVFTVW